MGAPENTFHVLGGIGTVLAAAYFIVQFLRKKTPTSLVNKVVVLTGASSGLGEALAHECYKSGAKVILCARRQNELARVKQNMLEDTSQKSTTNEPHVVMLDLTDFENIKNVVDKIVNIHGKVDVLINNGGISYRGDVMSTDLGVDKRVMDVNYFGQVALTKAILPVMKRNKSGHIVMVSSIQGKISIPFRSAYSASKHALEAFCDCLRAEVAGDNIHVTVVRPGYIKTSLSLNALTSDGGSYGVMDKTTESGMKPEAVAHETVQSIIYNQEEITLAVMLHRLVVYLRTLSPSLYFYVMKKRAKKQWKDMKKSK